MKFLHRAEISVFVKAEDDIAAVRTALCTLIPFSLDDEKVPIQDQIAEGFGGKQIRVLKVILKKTRHTNAFSKHLRALLGDKQLAILRDEKNRLDSQCHFYLRLDKPDVLVGKYVLTDGGDCFHFKLSIAAFPHNQDAARAVVNQLFSTDH